MLGLGSYESSDDESASASGKRTKLKSQQTTARSTALPSGPQSPETPATTGLSQKPKSPIADEATSTNETPIGPMVGPVAPSDPSNLSDSDSRGQSPYSASRSLIRDLTLPPVPNLDIPPSPPGSPQPSTSAKFAHFLELKKQGVHFNEKLAKSSALKNPSLLQKLMGFAGIDDQNQYASTLPTELWDPSGFPKWAYKEELAKSQQELSRRKEEEKARVQREALEFVPATGSGESTRVGTPGSGNVGGRGLKGSAAERVMAGLSRDRVQSPREPEGRPRKDLERRGGRYDGYRSRDRSRSRSPQRRRSRSR